jgi:hypothetical protein
MHATSELDWGHATGKKDSDWRRTPTGKKEERWRSRTAAIDIEVRVQGLGDSSPTAVEEVGGGTGHEAAELWRPLHSTRRWGGGGRQRKGGRRCTEKEDTVGRGHVVALLHGWLIRVTLLLIR